MKVKLTSFGARHFEPKFGGTKILKVTPEDFQKHIDDLLREDLPIGFKPKFIDGYASFCKLWPIHNFTDARVGSLPITLANYQFLRSGYSSRRDSELPVFSRWFELPLGKPRAEWLMLVLYSNEQLEKEAKEKHEENEIYTFDADYGIVAILGQTHDKEEPMKPETMLRNALGVSEGGSGVPLNREAYLRSVEFWERHATVK